MGKIIKKIVRALITITAILLTVPVILFLLLQAPRIQTFTVNKLTRLITEKTGAEIKIGRVSYSLFHEIVLQQVLFEDLRGDTLLMVDKVNLRVREIRASQNLYRFGKITLNTPDFRMIQDSTGVMNLTAYLQKLKPERERETLRQTDIRFPDILIRNGLYTLQIMSDSSGITPGKVNVKNMHLSSINGNVRDLAIIPDSVSMVLRGLNFSEAGGFAPRSIDLNLAVAKGDLLFREITIITDSSTLSAEKILFLTSDTASWKDFANSIMMEYQFNSSVVHSADLSYFVMPMRGINTKVKLAGRVTGTLSEMRGRDIRIDYESDTRLRFDFDISGLPAFSDSYLFVDFTDMRTSAADLEKLTLPGKNQTKLPLITHDLGLISYKGSFTGFPTDFVTFGRFTTERGIFETDLSLRPETRNNFSFRGSLMTSGVDLGYLTREREELKKKGVADENELFGGLWMHADVDGSVEYDQPSEKFRHLAATISGVIDSVEIYDYLYRNINVSGTYIDNIWDGNVEVREPNIEMYLMGRFDLEKSMPEFDFTMNLAHADLHTLNLIKRDSMFRASALITANFRGNNTENLEGDLRIINSTLENDNGKLSIYDFLVISEIINDESVLRLKSDFADVELKGHYSVNAVSRGVTQMLASLFPLKFKMPDVKRGEEPSIASFTIGSRIKKIDKLSDFLGLGLSISEKTLITGRFRSEDPEISAQIISDAISWSGIRMSQLQITGQATNKTISTTLTADSLRLPDGSELAGFSLLAKNLSDTLDLGIRWDNNDEGETIGEIKSRGFFAAGAYSEPVMIITILPAVFTVNHQPWSISPARVVIDSASTTFDNLLVHSSSNFLRLDGRLSRASGEKLTLNFEGLNLSYFNKLLKPQQPAAEDRLQMKLAGEMNGNITISDIYNDLLLESSITVNDFYLNENSYGIMTISSEWDPRRKVAMIDVSNDLHGHRSIDIKGHYSPSGRNADITAITTDLPLELLNPLVRSFGSEVRGIASGSIRLQGRLKEPELTGALMARSASMKIDFLQTRYYFSDSVRFTPGGIIFKNIAISDEKKNQGTLNGMITHHSFKDIGVTLDINMDKMLVLNTRPRDNDNFYGTAYASGYAGIRVRDDKVSLNISAKTAPDTEFFIPLNSMASVSDYPYITFISHNKEEDVSRNIGLNNSIQQEKSGKMELTFDLEVTPDAEVQLIMDETAGGVIHGKGEGNLNISLNSRGDIRMSGTYAISDGDYLFTLGNILNKRLAIQSGGTVTWNGAIEDADLNIKALYRTKASLSELFGESDFSELRVKMPVECILSLSGRLLNPAINFDINLPTADERTRELLKVAVNTEEELSKQFMYLLVMNSFYPDPSLYNSGTTAGNAYTPTGSSVVLQGGVTTTTEMFFNQFSNWLSQISNDFDVGFNYRPGNELTDQEVELALSTQLLNDKVTVNGNVDVRGNQSNRNTSNISGEFTVEVRLTDMLRFKVFNRSNYNLYYQVHPYTQGMGLFYRRDFNRLKELFGRKEEGVVIADPERDEEPEN